MAMYNSRVAIAAISLAAMSSGNPLVNSIRPDRLDGRLGRDRSHGGVLAYAAAPTGYMGPGQLVARSTYLARKRQTHRGKRHGRR